ncbi:Leucine-rich repeat protein SHOC-2 [Neochlamydia sp. EPS4]|uniref:leucine-rich repeat domain-containing protein n=1 Tax=Neochlamydia sp. EPS4 TaxID=1478175 RepID=UPI000583C8B8|nr:leucine-rich repeat domain-containing protein [Neochlamydia sp. EPS4]KIC75396.1 Leucine-rich repeat protein SHOC-2 [Neochlamydia sp. EPS4]
MMPSNSTSSTLTTFRTTVSENIEDAVSGELMTQAVTLFPCGHTFNEDTVIQCLARNKLCPLDRRLIERHAPNYTVRHLAETAESHPLEELKHEPSEEAVGHFLRGKELAEKGEHAIAIEALLQALQLTPTYEKAQAYLEFCLKRSSETSSSSQPLPVCFDNKEKGKEKSLPSADSYKERYTELLFNLLEEPSIQEHSTLKKMLENQLEELMSQDSEELTQKDKLSYKWTEKLLGENKKIRQFAVEKLRQIYQEPSSPLPTVAPQTSISTASLLSPTSRPATTNTSLFSATKEIQPLSPLSITPISMASLYNAIIQVHFPEENRNFIAQAGILDEIYEIKPNLSIEEKVPYIFQKLFTLAASLSPVEFEGNATESKAFTLSNYSSYLLNINRLLIWQKLPGGTGFLNQPHIKALPLKKKGELLTRWIKEYGKDITSLNLDKLRLTSLPPEIMQLTKLQKLELSGNQLTALPAELWQLSQMQYLHVSSNQLTSISAAIGQLSQLHTLDLDNNQLTSLPASIGQLAKLKLLGLGENQIATIPAELWQLSQLKKLWLSSNQLTTLPATIGQLSQLQELYLHNNQLTSIPAVIGQLSQLRRLDLDNNQLTALPAVIGQLSQLQYLHASSNQLTSISAAIGQLSQLHTLDLDNNQLTILPTELWQLSQLQEIYLQNNQLTSISAAIRQLSQLHTLDLGNNQLTSLPVAIGQLSQLRRLGLDNNQLTALPVGIGQLSQLQELDLSQNQLTALPTEIEQLSQLQWLDLSQGQLTSLPAEIGQLSQLIALNLCNNRLTAIPAKIGQLSQLQELYLSNNKLTSIPAAIGQLSRLRTLDLGNNQLTILPAELWQLSQLQGLDLAHNQLTALPATIGQLSQLQELYLSNNKLTSLPQLSKLRTLEIYGNPGLYSEEDNDDFLEAF